MIEGPRELGDLRPLRRLLADIGERIEVEKQWNGGDSPTAHTLVVVRVKLAEAIEQAATTPKELTLEEYAALEGITLEAARKRWRRGRIQGARKDDAGRVVIPMNVAA